MTRLPSASPTSRSIAACGTKGQNTDLVVVLRSAEQQLNKLPFDLLKAGRQLTFALHQLFPKLNYPVIAGLDRSLPRRH